MPRVITKWDFRFILWYHGCISYQWITSKKSAPKKRTDISHLNPSSRMTPISAAHSRTAHITFLMKCLASASLRKPWADVEAANAWNKLSFASSFSSGTHDFWCCFWNKAMMNSLTLFFDRCAYWAAHPDFDDKL